MYLTKHPSSPLLKKLKQETLKLAGRQPGWFGGAQYLPPRLRSPGPPSPLPPPALPPELWESGSQTREVHKSNFKQEGNPLRLMEFTRMGKPPLGSLLKQNIWTTSPALVRLPPPLPPLLSFSSSSSFCHCLPQSVKTNNKKHRIIS